MNQILRNFLAARGVSGQGQQLHRVAPGVAVLRDSQGFGNSLAGLREVAQFRLAPGLVNQNHAAKFLISQALRGALTLGVSGADALQPAQRALATGVHPEHDRFFRLSRGPLQFVALGGFIAANEGEF